MTSLTMYRYSVTGDFGYAGYINNKQIFRVSEAPLPDNPIKIQIGSDFYRSTYTDGSVFRGGWVVKPVEAPAVEDPTVRFIKSAEGDLIAQLRWRDNHYMLFYGGMNVEIRNKERKYIFISDGNIIATIQKSDFDKQDVPYWLKNGNSYTWENALELSYEENLPEILIGFIFAFPMLRFDYFLRKNGINQ